MAATVPITLRHGRPFPPGRSFKRWCMRLDSVTQNDPGEVQAAVIEPMRYDNRSRREDDNDLGLDPDVIQRINRGYKINKGMTKELIGAAVLTHVDSPREVRANCFLNARGHPNKCAPHGYPDVVFEPTAGTPAFRIVCEVSANRDFSVDTLEKQLTSALNHARELNKKDRRSVTYGLLVNPGQIGSDPALQKRYRAFVSDKERKLTLRGPIRLVSIYTGDFVTALYRLEAAGLLTFSGRLFARVLNALHKRLRDDIPEEEDWMANIFVQTIAKGMHRQGDLFDGGA